MHFFFFFRLLLNNNRRQFAVHLNMSGSGKSILGLWLYRSGEQEWAVKQGSPLHKRRNHLVSEEFFHFYSQHLRQYNPHV